MVTHFVSRSVIKDYSKLRAYNRFKKRHGRDALLGFWQSDNNAYTFEYVKRRKK